VGTRLRSILINLTVTLVTVAIFYVVASALMFRFAPEVSPTLIRSMPMGLRILAQSSKADRVPQNFIAIIGDSYAEGLGDWLASVGSTPGASYSAAHVLHDLSGRDVVSFGYGGASNARSMVQMPTRALGSGRCARLTGIPDPVEAFIYFYEGNDLSDNLGFLRDIGVSPGNRDLPSRVEAYLRDRYGRISSAACLGDFADAVYALSEVAFASVFGAREEVDTAPPSDGSEVVVGGARFQLPSRLQVPPIQLDATETEAALTVFDLSLRWLKARLPATRFTVVYLPAPTTVYRYTGEDLKVRRRGEEVIVPLAALFASSDATCAAVRDATLRSDVRFIDSRPAIRAAAERDVLHGPLDWLHFNQIGYTALGQLLYGRLADDLSDMDCTTPPEAMHAEPVPTPVAL
jgi:hypothetical protein